MNTTTMAYYSDCSELIAEEDVRVAAQAALVSAAELFDVDRPPLRWCVPASRAEHEYAAEWGEYPGPVLEARWDLVAVLGDSGCVWAHAIRDDPVTMFCAVAAAVSDRARRLAP